MVKSSAVDVFLLKDGPGGGPSFKTELSSVLDGEIAEVETLACLTAIRTMHGEIDLNAVAVPRGRDADRSSAFGTSRDIDAVDRLPLGGVVDKHHDFVGGFGVAFTAVVAPAEAQSVAIDRSRRVIGEIDFAGADNDVVVGQLVVRPSATDTIFEVDRHSSILSGDADSHVSESDADVIVVDSDELADEGESPSDFLLLFSVRVVVAESTSLNDCFTFPRGSGNGTHFT